VAALDADADELAVQRRSMNAEAEQDRPAEVPTGGLDADAELNPIDDTEEAIDSFSRLEISGGTSLLRAPVTYVVVAAVVLSGFLSYRLFGPGHLTGGALGSTDIGVGEIFARLLGRHLDTPTGPPGPSARRTSEWERSSPACSAATSTSRPAQRFLPTPTASFSGSSPCSSSAMSTSWSDRCCWPPRSLPASPPMPAPAVCAHVDGCADSSPCCGSPPRCSSPQSPTAASAWFSSGSPHPCWSSPCAGACAPGRSRPVPEADSCCSSSSPASR